MRSSGARRRSVLLAIGLVAAGAAPAIAGTAGLRAGPPSLPTTPAVRDAEPVILTGASFPGWAAPAEVSAKVPTIAGAQCIGGQDETKCTHNQYDQPEVATGNAAGNGVAVDSLLGYRWDTATNAFVQVPFQVDELAVRYLSNNNSGFSIYSETDAHATYVFDQERFRWTKSAADDPCRAVPDGPPTTPDPVPGLDTDDEVVFQASDAGPAAPASAALPAGVLGVRDVTLTDPLTQRQTHLYVMQAAPNGPKAAFNASTGYVRYAPDKDSDTFLFSESSYEDYGAAAAGPWFDPTLGEKGTCISDPAKWKQHRPKDTATIRTPTYSYRYEGRWLMTEHHVAPVGANNALTADPTTWTYGPDLVDQWKARAFQQRPGGETPCCGYEEEVNNWGGSSILMGVRSGPVRTIRATWGADSSTNNIRQEVFYRDEVRMLTNLRVHVIPPFDGIYAQWDMNAGKVTKYYNPYLADGVPVDGKNDEVFGNAHMRIGSDGVGYHSDDPTPVVGPINQGVGEQGRCPNDACVNNDVDTFDPTFGGPNAGLNWEQLTGPYGTFVERTTAKQVNGGTAYSVVTTPYYRDDSCFDDGTGTDPGLHVKPRKVDSNIAADGTPRVCWDTKDGDPLDLKFARDHFFQGDIGTHGVHILLIADSDNAGTTLPITEIAGDSRRVVLRGERGNVGEQYGRSFDQPLVATVTPR